MVKTKNPLISTLRFRFLAYFFAARTQKWSKLKIFVIFPMLYSNFQSWLCPAFQLWTPIIFIFFHSCGNKFGILYYFNFAIYRSKTRQKSVFRTLVNRTSGRPYSRYNSGLTKCHGRFTLTRLSGSWIHFLFHRFNQLFVHLLCSFSFYAFESYEKTQ